MFVTLQQKTTTTTRVNGKRKDKGRIKHVEVQFGSFHDVQLFELSRTHFERSEDNEGKFYEFKLIFNFTFFHSFSIS
jgi:hypothetical protein